MMGLRLLELVMLGSAFVATVNTRASAADPAKPAGPPPFAKRLPPLGIDLPADKRVELQQELDALATQIARIEGSNDLRIQALAPDVRIFWKAVNTALADGEFYKPAEIEAAFNLLREGRARADSLERGDAPWTAAHGLVVRGYVSRIDGSVQPYGLVIPDSYASAGGEKHRLDLWFHGRGEMLSELNFLRDRERNVGTFAPRDAIVLHPYGRYCNANKFAGEIDVFESIDSVRRRYRIDEDRIVVRGFSMGGASTWHLAVHYPTLWAAANPGAGFAETPKFSKVFHKETLAPTWWETKLYHLYDATDWASNLWHCPVIAYSGELDSQKQAADIMAAALRKEGMELVHVIGPKTKHSYHPEARNEVERRITVLADRGRESLPENIRFVTYTLRYNRCGWITIDALDRHWEKARIEAHCNEAGGISICTENVKGFTIHWPPGRAPIRLSTTDAFPICILAGRSGNSSRPQQTLQVKPLTRSDRSLSVSFHRDMEHWAEGPLPGEGLRKTHGLQGPIDDAFLEPFLFVRPTGKGPSPQIDAWVQREMQRAISEWRRQFRGEPRVKNDGDVTADDIASMNLVLWGGVGPASANSMIRRISAKLPIRDDQNELAAGNRHFEAAHHVPILIYPNPLNTSRYVVLNSGFTFREHAYLSNAYQVPKLPDWAIVDIRTPPDAQWPGKIVAADFFDEEWHVRAENPR